MLCRVPCETDAEAWSVDSDLRLFGQRLKGARNARKITQEKLAELAQLNPRTVQKIEAGQVDILLTTALRLQRALDCPIAEIWP